MSHQPSTLDNVRNAASSATHAVADSLDTSSSSESLGSGANSRESTEIKGGYAKDALGNVSEKGSYKDQLNKAAFEGKEGVLAMNKEPDTMMNKGMSAKSSLNIVRVRHRGKCLQTILKL